MRSRGFVNKTARALLTHAVANLDLAYQPEPNRTERRCAERRRGKALLRRPAATAKRPTKSDFPEHGPRSRSRTARAKQFAQTSSELTED
jgi:hypothetical protein